MFKMPTSHNRTEVAQRKNERSLMQAVRKSKEWFPVLREAMRNDYLQPVL